LSTGATEIIEDGEGAPLVLIHGGLSEASDWVPLISRLVGKFHLYVPDRPGHGLSDPFDYRGIDPAELCASFLKDLLDSCGLGTVPLVGCSMGGFCAISFYLRHPDRVSRLILPGMPAGLQQAVPSVIYEAQKLMHELSSPTPGKLIRSQLADPSARERMRAVVSGISAHPERVPEEFLDCMRFNTLRNYRSFETYLDGMVTEEGLVPSMLLDRRWAQLRVPTTFIWGEKDIFSTVEKGRASAALVPTSRFELIPDAGHNVYADAPQRVASIILDSLGPQVGTVTTD
jgi:pimeloyl-ACP methyl ester carboxylesterase